MFAVANYGLLVSSLWLTMALMVVLTLNWICRLILLLVQLMLDPVDPYPTVDVKEENI